LSAEIGANGKGRRRATDSSLAFDITVGKLRDRNGEFRDENRHGLPLLGLRLALKGNNGVRRWSVMKLAEDSILPVKFLETEPRSGTLAHAVQ